MSTPPSFPLTSDEIETLVSGALDEDIASGDITSNHVIGPDARLAAAMIARQPLTVCGVDIVEAVFSVIDPDCKVGIMIGDGARAGEGDAILAVSGNARALLAAERTALNFIQHLSGIATLTRRYVDEIAGTGATLLDTRKTLPGWRRLEKYATACGGARNHRMGLYDAVLIKDNHIAVCGSVESAVAAARDSAMTDIRVECDQLDQVEQALAAGADSILLDNMTPEALRQAVRMTDGRVPLEASGGVRLDSIRAIAETGVDFVSASAITQSAPAVDIALDYKADAHDRG